MALLHPQGGGQTLGCFDCEPRGKPAYHTREIADRVSPRQRASRCIDYRAFSRSCALSYAAEPAYLVDQLRTHLARPAPER